LVKVRGVYPKKGEFERRSLWGLMVDVDVDGLSLKFRRKYYLMWEIQVSGRPWAMVPVTHCSELIEEYGILRGSVLCRKLKLK